MKKKNRTKIDLEKIEEKLKKSLNTRFFQKLCANKIFTKNSSAVQVSFKTIPVAMTNE